MLSSQQVGSHSHLACICCILYVAVNGLWCHSRALVGTEQSLVNTTADMDGTQFVLTAGRLTVSDENPPAASIVAVSVNSPDSSSDWVTACVPVHVTGLLTARSVGGSVMQLKLTAVTAEVLMMTLRSGTLPVLVSVKV